MSTKPNDGGPAFPYRDEDGEGGFDQYSGISMRDWFAGQIACGDASAGYEGGEWTSNMEVLPKYAAIRAKVYYVIADAMIAERNKE